MINKLTKDNYCSWYCDFVTGYTGTTCKKLQIPINPYKSYNINVTVYNFSLLYEFH